MKRIDLRCDPNAPSYTVAVFHFLEKEDGKWRTSGAVEVFEVTNKSEAERIARGHSGKGRTIDISFDGKEAGHINLHSTRLVWR